MKSFLIKAAYIAFMVGLAFLIIFLIGRSVAPELMVAFKSGDEAAIELYLEQNNNIQGIVLTVVLQIIQVMSIVIPCMPIQVAAGVVFGTVRGFLITWLANLLANTLVYLIYKNAQKKLDEILNLKSNGKLTKLLNSALPPSVMVGLTALIPAIPNGFVPYLAVMAKVPLLQFVIAIAVGSFAPVLTLNIIGHRILSGDYTLVIILIVVAIAAVLLLVKFQNQIMNFINVKILHRSPNPNNEAEASEENSDEMPENEIEANQKIV